LKSLWLSVGMLLAGLLPAGFLWAASTASCPDPPPVDRDLYAVLQKAQNCLDAGRHRVALATLSAYAAAHPKIKHYHLSFLMGTASYQTQQFAGAETCFTAAAALRPCAVEAWESVAAARMARTNHAGAAAALAVAFRLSPPDGKGWRQLGDLYRLAGVPREAARAYLKAFGNDAGAAELDLLSDTWLQAHELDKALVAVRLAAGKVPTAKRWARVGDICLNQKKFQESLTAYRNAAAMDDPDGRMSLMAGVAALKLERLSVATDCFSSAIQNAAPKSAVARKASAYLTVLSASQKNASFSERGMN